MFHSLEFAMCFGDMDSLKPTYFTTATDYPDPCYVTNKNEICSELQSRMWQLKVDGCSQYTWNENRTQLQYMRDPWSVSMQREEELYLLKARAIAFVTKYGLALLLTFCPLCLKCSGMFPVSLKNLYKMFFLLLPRVTFPSKMFLDNDWTSWILLQHIGCQWQSQHLLLVI